MGGGGWISWKYSHSAQLSWGFGWALQLFNPNCFELYFILGPVKLQFWTIHMTVCLQDQKMLRAKIFLLWVSQDLIFTGVWHKYIIIVKNKSIVVTSQEIVFDDLSCSYNTQHWWPNHSWLALILITTKTDISSIYLVSNTHSSPFINPATFIEFHNLICKIPPVVILRKFLLLRNIKICFWATQETLQLRHITNST